jgi:hypothetical protein
MISDKLARLIVHQFAAPQVIDAVVRGPHAQFALLSPRENMTALQTAQERALLIIYQLEIALAPWTRSQ